MRHSLRISTPRAAFAALLAAGLLGACESAPEASLGQAITQGTVTVQVDEADLRFLDLEGPTGGAQTEAPHLVVRVSLTNNGGDPLTYDLGWSLSAGTQADTPLLFVDPGADAEPTAGANITGTMLSSYAWLDDPITGTTSVAGGATIDDWLVFDAPPEGATHLVLSLPPRMFGPEVSAPAYVRFPAPSGEVAPPAFAPAGEAIEGDGFRFRVVGTETRWARLNSATEGEGFSSEPLLFLHFEVTNTGTTTAEWVPVSADGRFDAPALSTLDGTPIARAEFAPGVTPTESASDRQAIGAGETYRGTLLFKRPAQGATDLRLTLPGKRLGATGLVRAMVSYAYADPAEPAELTPQEITQPADE